MRRIAVLAALVLLLTGCGSGRGSSPAATATSDGPTAAALLVCSDEAVEDIAQALGVRTTVPPSAAWVDHTYTCTYRYTPGTMLVSVKVLADNKATDAYVAATMKQVGATSTLNVLGQSGFLAPNGDIFVRKDANLLGVDVTGLPEPFGSARMTRQQVSFAVAAAIIECWKEA